MQYVCRGTAIPAEYRSDAISTTSKIDAAANALDTVSNKAGAAAKALAPVSAGAAAVGAASYAAAMDIDNGYDIVITKTGATGEALENLQGSMENIFTSLPIDAETAGTAIGEVNTRFQLTGEELEKLSQQFIEFSEINDTDLNTSIDNVDTILNKFNVDASQAGNVLGLLTKTGQDTGLSMDTLENSLMQNGSTLKEMGLGITESVNLLAAFENNGVDATTAMAGLKKSVKNYTAEGLSTNEALQKTIDRIKNASTETEALSIAQETFGSKGFAEMAQAIREGKLSLDDLEELAHSIYMWLYASGIEYSRLYDTYNTERYRLAYINSNASVSELAKRLLGEIEITFMCKAYERRLNGDKTITLTKAATIYNTEGFTATPYIKITGSGGITLYINNRAHTFKDVNEYIEIDGEIMNAYKGDLLQNSKMVTTLFPKLAAGANNISWAGNVTKVEIIPRWCRL